MPRKSYESISMRVPIGTDLPQVDRRYFLRNECRTVVVECIEKIVWAIDRKHLLVHILASNDFGRLRDDDEDDR